MTQSPITRTLSASTYEDAGFIRLGGDIDLANSEQLCQEEQGAMDRALIASLRAQGELDRTLIANLENAILSARRIGVALGILMTSRKVTEEIAFTMLKSASQHGHRKVRDVADDVVFTGVIPG